MKIVKNIYPKETLTVLDFGSEVVAAFVAQKKSDGTFHILGAGDSKTRGVKNGEIQNLGDAVEPVVEALRKAEDSSDAASGTVYFNFDDCQMQSERFRGSKTLAGEGEIELSDIEEAKAAALRMAGHFEKRIVYAKEVSFIIDERDTVENPVGVFGRRLDVVVHVLQARSLYCEEWEKIMKRAQVDRAVLVPSAWSTACGILPKEDRKRKRLIVDWGNDYVNVFVFGDNRIYEHRTLLASTVVQKGASELSFLCEKFKDAYADIDQHLLTGDDAQREGNLDALKNGANLSFELAAPVGVPKLTSPRFSSAAGLFSIADEIERKMPFLRKKGLLGNVRKKAIAFINEYF